MITSALLLLVNVTVSAITSLLPNLTVPTFFTTDNLGSTLASTIGSIVGAVHDFLPVVPLLVVLAALIPLWLVIVAYVAFQWIWNHIPTIAGFGTH